MVVRKFIHGNFENAHVLNHFNASKLLFNGAAWAGNTVALTGRNMSSLDDRNL
jgi:hypothetical protein